MILPLGIVMARLTRPGFLRLFQATHIAIVEVLVMTCRNRFRGALFPTCRLIIPFRQTAAVQVEAARCLSTREASNAAALEFPVARPRRVGRQLTATSNSRTARASFRAAQLPLVKAHQRILADSVRFDAVCPKPAVSVWLRRRAACAI